jgi:hypothetical protein
MRYYLPQNFQMGKIFPLLVEKKSTLSYHYFYLQLKHFCSGIIYLIKSFIIYIEALAKSPNSVIPAAILSGNLVLFARGSIK